MGFEVKSKWSSGGTREWNGSPFEEPLNEDSILDKIKNRKRPHLSVTPRVNPDKASGKSNTLVNPDRRCLDAGAKKTEQILNVIVPIFGFGSILFCVGGFGLALGVMGLVIIRIWSQYTKNPKFLSKYKLCCKIGIGLSILANSALVLQTLFSMVE